MLYVILTQTLTQTSKLSFKLTKLEILKSGQL